MQDLQEIKNDYNILAGQNVYVKTYKLYMAFRAYAYRHKWDICARKEDDGWRIWRLS